MRIEITEHARASLLRSKAFYNKQQLGLGLQFVNEFKSAVKRIKENPKAWPKQRNVAY